ncbi:MAG: type II toxin-antitoxin system RelE/ParE family toxin [Bacteroidota bacterium]
MRSIVWSKSAEDSFFNHLRYIEADSPTSAEKVARELIIVIDDLITNPEKFPPDRFKMANDGSYRASGTLAQIRQKPNDCRSTDLLRSQNVPNQAKAMLNTGPMAVAQYQGRPASLHEVQMLHALKSRVSGQHPQTIFPTTK